jgi:hypothetical protein
VREARRCACCGSRSPIQCSCMPQYKDNQATSELSSSSRLALYCAAAQGNLHSACWRSEIERGVLI